MEDLTRCIQFDFSDFGLDPALAPGIPVDEDDAVLGILSETLRPMAQLHLQLNLAVAEIHRKQPLMRGQMGNFEPSDRLRYTTLCAQLTYVEQMLLVLMAQEFNVLDEMPAMEIRAGWTVVRFIPPHPDMVIKLLFVGDAPFTSMQSH